MRKTNQTKEALIRAGIHELRTYGFTDFSIRRIAAECGVSCATPYRHFKNKDEFVLEIFKYINRRWYTTQNMILSEYDSARERLIEMSVAYIRFLRENPDYCTIIMLHSPAMSDDQRREKHGISSCVRGLVRQYCDETGMDEPSRVRKTYVVRSLIFGAALMMAGGELDDDEETFDMIRATVAREFDLP